MTGGIFDKWRNPPTADLIHRFDTQVEGGAGTCHSSVRRVSNHQDDVSQSKLAKFSYERPSSVFMQWRVCGFGCLGAVSVQDKHGYLPSYNCPVPTITSAFLCIRIYTVARWTFYKAGQLSERSRGTINGAWRVERKRRSKSGLRIERLALITHVACPERMVNHAVHSRSAFIFTVQPSLFRWTLSARLGACKRRSITSSISCCSRAGSLGGWLNYQPKASIFKSCFARFLDHLLAEILN